MVHTWLHFLSYLSLAIGLASALWLGLEMVRRPQEMAIMNWVWPLVGLAGGPLVIWLYRRQAAYGHGEAPMPLMVAVETCHCGAGCTLGDILAETMAMAWPGILVWFGLGSLFHQSMFAGWLLDFVLAFLFGIIFQYFSIAPMRHLGLAEGLAAAIKADSLALSAWQAGMYGVMALVQFGIMRLTPGQPEFWLAMQLAMLGGFAFSYPMNWWLLRVGIKEKM
jgi:hypothetical protein